MAARRTHWSDWLIVAALLPPLLVHTAGALLGRALRITTVERWCRHRAVALGALARRRLAGLPDP